MLFAALLGRLFRLGDLTLVDAAGRVHRFAGPPLPGIPPVTVRLHDPRLHWRLPLNPGLVAGEAYTDGTLTVESGTLRDLLALACTNIEHAGRPILPFWRIARLLHQYNPVHRSRQNVAHHYDLTGALYERFLDADRQYSCAYFSRPGLSLEEAQEAKKRHIAAKLRLAEGQRVLDIGSGWGGMALTLARLAKVEVLGITLSEEQLAVARHRAETAGLSQRVRFELMDWRHLTGRFDRIVSVGMFEHVGLPSYRRFFRTLARLLPEDGIGLLHSIGRAHGPAATNPWMRKYIFPGGYAPALSEVLPAIEDAGLWATDIEILRLHYAETLREWQRRFAGHRTEIAALLDERFCRMWEFYLIGAEMAFRTQGQMVFQIQLARHVEAAPLTRDYITETERTLEASRGMQAAE